MTIKIDRPDRVLSIELVCWLVQWSSGSVMRTSARLAHSAVLAEAPGFRGAIVKRSVKDLIGDKLEALIASGILQVGDTLPGERDLAFALNVSRDTIRGAVERLAARGVLEISHGARTRVVRGVDPVPVGFATARAVDGYDIESVHGTRLVLEREVVADAAGRMDKTTLAALTAAIEAQEAAQNDPVRFLIADREFHFAVYRRCANRLLADITCDLYAYMMEQRRAAVARPGAIPTSIGDHRVIEAALRGHDPDAAVAAFVRHTERIYETTRSVIGTPGAS